MENLIWTEKYRPYKLDNIANQEDAVKILKNIVITKKMQHLLLYGPAGVGKTSAALALCLELYNKIHIDDMVLELNASDERGINTVRKEIKDFTEKKIISTYPFKIIILDESDELTNEAQSALRQIIGETTNTRFCFICNYPNKIIVPLLSRCSKIQFNPIPSSAITLKLNEIAKKENMEINNECMENLVKYSYGDMRRCILLLQQLYYVYKNNNKVILNDVYEITNIIDINVIQPLFIEKCDVMEITNKIINGGYNAQYIIYILNDLNIQSKLDNIAKAKISLKILETAKFLIDGGTEFIQLLNLLTFINNNI